MLSAPQMPQPVRPVRRRDRAAITSSHAAETVACTSIPRLYLMDLDLVQVVPGADQLLGQAEAEGEVLQILRRGHHDDVRNAVVDHRDRNLLGDGLRMLHRAAILPAPRPELEQRAGVSQPLQPQRILHLGRCLGA